MGGRWEGEVGGGGVVGGGRRGGEVGGGRWEGEGWGEVGGFGPVPKSSGSVPFGSGRFDAILGESIVETAMTAATRKSPSLIVSPRELEATESDPR